MKTRKIIAVFLWFFCCAAPVLAAEPVLPWMLADWENPTPHFADTGLKAGEVGVAIGKRLVIFPHPHRDIVMPGAKGPRSFQQARFVSAVARVDLPAATLRRRMQDFAGYKNLFPMLTESEVQSLEGRNLVTRYRVEVPLPALATITVDFRVKNKLEPDGSISTLLIDGKAESLIAMLGGMTDELANQPVLSRWEFLPLNEKQSLLVFTYWDRLELKSFFARKFMAAYPELSVIKPYLIAATIAEVVHRDFIAAVPVLDEPSPQGMRQLESMRRLIENRSTFGHVAIMEPEQLPAAGLKVAPLRYASIATRIQASPDSTRGWATRYERLPDVLKELQRIGVNDRGQQIDLNIGIRFAVLIIRFSLDLDVLNTWVTPQRLEFKRTAGQLAQLRGASEWHELPGNEGTLMLVSAAHEVGEEAPLLLRLAHRITERIPYADPVASMAVQLVVMERLKPWIEKNAVNDKVVPARSVSQQ